MLPLYKILYRQKSKTILEVAYQYGFESHEGFTRSFKRFFGFSPKVIKDQNVAYTIPNYCVMKERSIEIMNSKNIIEEKNQLLKCKRDIVQKYVYLCYKITISKLWMTVEEFLWWKKCKKVTKY